MAIEVLETVPDGRPSRVRISSAVNLASEIWQFKDPSSVSVAAGGTIEWEFTGLSADDRPEIRFVGVEPLDAGQPIFFDPIETLERLPDRIVGTIFPEARGNYRYLVIVERAGKRIQLRCQPARMGGVDVSGPPVRP